MKKAVFVFFCFFSVVLCCSCNPKPYIITQYGNDAGATEMCYSINTPDGGLIMIDGGFAENADNVREIILENGGVVDVWILTHPHPDHIGAFNDIFENPGDIKIKQVYASDIDYEYYHEKQHPWDEFDVYLKFLELMEAYDSLTYLYENDELNICGLDTIVLNAANTDTDDPANDGSLVFKMTGKEQSILFTGDAGEWRSEPILQNHKEQLNADYLQMAHHANGGLSDEVYQAVVPSIAFADCPQWLREDIDPATGESGSWTTPERIQLMKDMGATVLSYDTAPNSIELY